MSGIALWASRYCYGDIRKHERISIKGSRFTILPNIVPWRRALAKTRGGKLVLSIMRYLVARLSRGRARGPHDALNDAREIGQAASLIMCACSSLLTPLRKLHDSKRASR